MAFLMNMIRNDGIANKMSSESGETERYEIRIHVDPATYEQWICGIFTKTVCEARNRNHLLKAVSLEEGMGLVENRNFFLIKDNCLTELEPEEVDENGVSRTLTYIGFRPLQDDIAYAISGKFHLYV